MEKRRALRVALMIALAAATAVPCSWDTTPAFAFRVRPDEPVEDFIGGRIGIIRPEFARSHLVVAYRHLSGNPPSAEEQAGFLDLIGHRLDRSERGDDAAKTWEAARAEIRGVAAKKHDAARAELDAVLGQALGGSTRNLLLEQRRGLARSLAEYLRDARNMPVGNEAEQLPETFASPLLPEDAAAVLSNDMPLDLLAEAAEQELPASIGNPILIAAWTRAILLDRDDVAVRLAPRVLALAPSVEARFRAWREAKGDRRRFAAADLFVHHAAMQTEIQAYGGRLADERDFETVSHGGGNWWCSGRPSEPRVTPPFLAEHASQAAAEQLALLELQSATTWMLRTFLDMADAQPKDPRVPEGLSLAIHGTRWSCGDGDTDDLARRAFNVLHRRYPGTKWAKETPYWYRSGF